MTFGCDLLVRADCSGCASGGVEGFVEEAGLEIEDNGMPATVELEVGVCVGVRGGRDEAGVVGAAGPGAGIVVGSSSRTLAAFFGVGVG